MLDRFPFLTLKHRHGKKGGETPPSLFSYLLHPLKHAHGVRFASPCRIYQQGRCKALSELKSVPHRTLAQTKSSGDLSCGTRGNVKYFKRSHFWNESMRNTHINKHTHTHTSSLFLFIYARREGERKRGGDKPHILQKKKNGNEMSQKRNTLPSEIELGDRDFKRILRRVNCGFNLDVNGAAGDDYSDVVRLALVTIAIDPMHLSAGRRRSGTHKLLEHHEHKPFAPAADRRRIVGRERTPRQTRNNTRDNLEILIFSKGGIRGISKR